MWPTSKTPSHARTTRRSNLSYLPTASKSSKVTWASLSLTIKFLQKSICISDQVFFCFFHQTKHDIFNSLIARAHVAIQGYEKIKICAYFNCFELHIQQRNFLPAPRVVKKLAVCSHRLNTRRSARGNRKWPALASRMLMHMYILRAHTHTHTYPATAIEKQRYGVQLYLLKPLACS